MSRRKAAPKRIILPDPLFESELLAKFINIVMCDGKKSVAEKIVYGALDTALERIRSKEKDTPEDIDAKDSIKNNADLRTKALELFKKALDASRPTVEVRSRRIGGATYQVPVEVRSSRGTALSMRWLVDYAKQRGEKTMGQKLSGEILDAIEGRGGAVKKRETVHNMAKANQAFAHFRW